MQNPFYNLLGVVNTHPDEAEESIAVPAPGNPHTAGLTYGDLRYLQRFTRSVVSAGPELREVLLLEGARVIHPVRRLILLEELQAIEDAHQ